MEENIDFYSSVLGLRLVKKSSNQDSPGTYHLFYADGEGHPGTDITFFPWPEMPPAKPGIGLAMEVSLAVPLGSIDYWGADWRAPSSRRRNRGETWNIGAPVHRPARPASLNA